jgi:hypothetical protein
MFEFVAGPTRLQLQAFPMSRRVQVQIRREPFQTFRPKLLKFCSPINRSVTVGQSMPEFIFNFPATLTVDSFFRGV